MLCGALRSCDLALRSLLGAINWARYATLMARGCAGVLSSDHTQAVQAQPRQLLFLPYLGLEGVYLIEQ